MKRLGILLLLLAAAIPAQAQVAFDAVGPSSAGASASGTPTTLTWSHTCTGSNLVLIVVASFGALGGGSDSGVSLSATYNGVSMTSVAVVHSNNSDLGFVQMFRLVAPATGANNVVVTKSGGAGTWDLLGGSVSFTSVNQTTPLGTAATAFGSSAAPSVGVTGTTSGNMVIDGVANGAAITSSGQTNRWLKNLNSSSGAGNAASSTAAGNGGTVTMSYVVTSDWWGIIGVEVKASGGGGAVPPRRAPVVTQGNKLAKENRGDR